MLSSIGLDVLTESVYRCMLRHADWGVDRIAQHLNTGEAQVRQALDDLADVNLIQPSEDQPGLYRLVSPGVGLVPLLARSEAELYNRQQEIAEARAAIALIADEYHEVRNREEVTHLDGLDAVRARLEELAHGARTECLSFLPGGGQRPDTMDASRPLDERALRRGVRMRNVYQESYRNDPVTVQYVTWLAGLGAENRTMPVLPMLLVIVDREAALVPFDPAEGRRGALEVNAPGVIAALCALFEQVWEAAVPFGPPAPLTDEPPVQTLTLLRLLLAGDTDENAARKLGVSPRTVRRTVAETMAILKVQSRLQLGAKIVQQGWL